MNTNDLHWHSPIEKLKSRKSKNLTNLIESGYTLVEDLLWIIPRKVDVIPSPMPFTEAQDGAVFKGKGKVTQVQSRMNLYARGKGKVPLYNISVTVKDLMSDRVMSLKFFNSYPNMQKKLKGLENITFYGKVSTYAGMRQISNPTFSELTQEENDTDREKVEITYPTINKIPTKFIVELINTIPENLWNSIEETLPEDLVKQRDFMSLSRAFRIIHGKELYHKETYEEAKNRLIYEEFFQDQIKINLRKKVLTQEGGFQHSLNKTDLENIFRLFPYQLTEDQRKTITRIKDDLNSGLKMMRLVQGDVGCGKTTVALSSALMSIKSGYQAAMMAPTESLAIQHFLNFEKALKKTDIRIALILGSTKKSEKEKLYEIIKAGEIQFVIGTHSLIQDKLEFKKLGIAIIDEQHKFGVNQRIRLTSKNKGTHCLIMSATPIPRSLSLTQYGDLEISTIKTIPSNRKGTKTKIIKEEQFEKFLTFLNTRISMGEQAYLVVPAIEENEETGIVNLERIYNQFVNIFPELKIESIHGKFTADEKSDVFNRFKDKKIDILISTSVIEVGIDVANATVMAIFGPERFGLSSLHQLRGRVGRADKPGFCFLIAEKKLSPDSLARLEVIEQTSDGFKIAERDLELRGEGNIFGAEQSGDEKSKFLANIITHSNYLEMAREDISHLVSKEKTFLDAYQYKYSDNQYFNQTI